MRSLAIVVALTTLAHAEPAWPPADANGDPVDLATRLATAIRKHDAAGVHAMLAASLTHDGLWFADAACAKSFGQRGTTKHTRALAKCLAQQKLVASTRASGLVDGAVLTFEPGIEIEVVFDNDRVIYAGSLLPRDQDRGKPTLTAQAFEALRTAGTTQLDAALAGKFTGTASAWVKTCLDAAGAITSQTVVEAKPSTAGDAFLAATGNWAFKPFAKGAACSLTLLTYPTAAAPVLEVLPPTPTIPANLDIDDLIPDLKDFDRPASLDKFGPRSVYPSDLEKLRVGGTPHIDPDAKTKALVAKSNRTAIATLKLCVDAAGIVTTVTPIKSSGYPDYDAKLAREMQRWGFKPYLDRGRAVSACATFTFNYRAKP